MSREQTDLKDGLVRHTLKRQGDGWTDQVTAGTSYLQTQGILGPGTHRSPVPCRLL